MFPEYREQMAQLKANDRNFSRLVDKHALLDQQVQAMIDRRSPELQGEIDRLKKLKLSVKEEAYGLLRDAQPQLALQQYKNYLAPERQQGRLAG